MQSKFLSRLITVVCGLIVLLFGVWFIVGSLGIVPHINSELFGSFWMRTLWVVVGLLLCALGFLCVFNVFRNGQKKDFVIQHSEYGDMNISMNAMESMVKRCVNSHEEFTAGPTAISHSHEGIKVDIGITLKTCANIPFTVNALQKQIKDYVSTCSGVNVEEVSVMVDTEVSYLLPPQDLQTDSEIKQEPVITPEASPIDLPESSTADEENAEYSLGPEKAKEEEQITVEESFAEELNTDKFLPEESPVDKPLSESSYETEIPEEIEEESTVELDPQIVNESGTVEEDNETNNA